MRSTDRYAFEDIRCEIGGASLPVANLSLGGFFVACVPPLPRGQGVAFELVFPSGGRIPALGRVAWVNGTDEAGNPQLPVGCGISITKIAFPDKLALVQVLKRASTPPVRQSV